MEIIRDLGIPIDQIRCTGGGAKSDFWLQMQADIYNAPVVTVNSGEGPAMGAALMGGVAGGVFDDLAEAADEFVSVVTTAEPNPAVRNAYDDGYGLFRELYPALKKPFANASEVVARHHG
jgi:xylulokinase